MPPGGDPVDTNNNNQTDGSYFMKYTGTQAPSVFTQYPTYYLADNDDPRHIFVYGKDVSGQENWITKFQILNYFGGDEGTTFISAASEKDNRLYTQEIDLYGSNLSSDETWTINALNNDRIIFTQSFNVQKIEDRVLEVNSYYYVQQNSDIKDILKTEHNVNPRAELESIFNEANITTNIPFIGGVILDNIPIELTANYKLELMQYAKDNTDFYSHFDDSKYIILIGMQNYTVGAGFPGQPFEGITLQSPTQASVSFVFPDRCWISSDPTENKKNVVTTTAHELGHVRGKFLPPIGQVDRPYGSMVALTDSAHIYGHLGKHKQYCIMAHQNNYQDQQIVADDPHFCEGHLQMLLNTSFK